ncbi:MAG: pyridoxamine 5'-phosphate oxidase family protein [Chloroflexi bacterium]|nr:MAG: pyridoxamine 5'-phosphate oxidase family protein [Chloroflexota bacterium]TMF36410.1 MAG: pyridoxamine 5'-phosphate oxidase family protein [Chloroflexota bacterium]
MTVERRSRRFSSARLERVARRLMNASSLCSLATVSPGGRAHINHMYFAWNDRFDVFWISDRDSTHSRNVVRNSSAAVTIYASNQIWGKPDRGIQLLGTAHESTSRDSRNAYARRFRDFDPEENDLPYYRFRPRAVKLFDERSLAGGTIVTARVTRDGLAWSKTEVWV